MLNRRKPQRISTVIKNKASMTTAPLLFFKVYEVLTRLIGQMKEGYDINSKERCQIIFAHNMLLYIKGPKSPSDKSYS